ncbi:hypothetical protein RQP46_009489 [Phenoliferia psychrophenolica]
MDVLNRGMGGWNSRQLLQYLKSDMDVSKTADVRLFIIHVGGNDMCIGGLQSVLLPDYASNLRMIISHIRNTWYQASVLLVTPTFLDAERLKAFDRSLGIPPDLAPLRTDENAKRYVDACLLVGKETDTPVINVYQLHTEAREAGHTLKELFWDGLHYTPFGYSTINAAIVRAIDATCPASSAAAMPAAFPGYSTYACENDPRVIT